MDAHEAEQKERERNERRRREQRDQRNQRSKGENGPGSGPIRKGQRAPRDRKKGAPLDVIDKLDVTGIYGSGCKFYFGFLHVIVFNNFI
jgi:hypothetical protein